MFTFKNELLENLGFTLSLLERQETSVGPYVHKIFMVEFFEPNLSNYIHVNVF